MRVFSFPAAIAAFAALGVIAVADRPASAQFAQTSPQVSSDTTQTPQFTVRVGGYFTTDPTVRHTIGSSFIAAGADYDLHDEVGVSRTVISGDYIDRSSGGNSLRIVPVTLGQYAVSNPDNSYQYYFGGGAGMYFVHQDFGQGNQHDDARFGGYIGGGLILEKYLDLDLRYHLITSEHGFSPSGLEATVGIRF